MRYPISAIRYLLAMSPRIFTATNRQIVHAI
jgi:hypothetical protein